MTDAQVLPLAPIGPWTRLQQANHLIIVMLLGMAIGAWGQSISVQLPKVLWRAKHEQAVVAVVKLQQKKIEVGKAQEVYCRKLLAELAP